MRAGLSYFNNTVVFIFIFGISAFALSGTTGLAADFTAGTDQELRNAIAAANASADTSSTITLTGNFTMGTTALPVPTKSITIDAQGFTLSGPPGVNSSGAPQFRNLNGSNITLLGNYVGGTGTAGANSTGGYGLFALGTGTSPLIVNNGTLTGGVGYIAGGRGGAGARVQSGIFINNGTAQGGSGRGALQGGVGVEISTASLTNSGRIQGGSGPTGGAGVQAIGGTTNSLVNTGTIRGGTGVSGSVLASGVLWGTGFATLDNQGTIEGGTGGAGIWSGTSITATNSGTIRAGSGQANAIMVGSGATAFLNLTLKAGSVIEGNVVGSSAGTNDVLRFGGAADAGFDVSALGPTAQYRNFDMLEKADTGTWTLSGSSDFAGPTNILAGKLVVNGALAGSAVTVAAGATLAGSGTVGATTIAAGGTIAPGNSIGTITVNGAFVQQAGSTYQVEVDPGTMTSDLIKVNGTATLANGATVSVVNYTGAAYAAGQRYTILTSTGLTGTYGFPEQVLTPFLSLRDSYDTRNAYLTVVQTRSVGEVGTTPNEIAVGKSVDSLPAGDPIQSGMLNQPSIDAAQRALNQLSGEIHASAKTALIEESWLLRAAINDRLRAAFGSVGSAALNYGYSADLAPGARGPMPLPQTNRFAVWGQGYGSWGRADSDGNAARLKRSTGGFLLGADAAVFDKLRFGVVAGYSRSDFDVDSRLSSGESDNYHLGLYGGGQWGALNLRAGASYTWHDVETRRALTSAYIGGTPHASYNAATAQAFGEVGYRLELGRAALEPFAGLAYVDLHSDGFSETGATAALTSQGGDTRVGYSTLGLRSSTQFDLQGMAMTLRGGLAWRHAFGDVDPKATLAFAGSSAFTIAGLPIARDAAMAEAGLDLAIGRNATLGVSYAGQLAEDAQDHSFKGVLAVRF
ncbi:autotransporter outer membrane beta-barrel domain-containing protein [Bosea psychrotolerans]|uniref:Outer membrane autotransporter protein n=1 Tax=Bosea psychrotolerans TaxID=1871628 RepID=A0A2S4M6P4_9HYPH|nr:autotransporter domain-containing protein [Bosea psychrotolerans]POR50394.1 outer membrane autotransporter protein [Bosea psychrotolerans]